MSGPGVLNFLTKSLGAATIGLIAYDAHNAGKIQAPMYRKNYKADQMANLYLHDRKLSSPSVVEDAAKKRIFKYFLDERLTSVFTSAIGYVKGAASIVINNVIPFGLACGTFVGKGAFSKLCGAGILAYGGLFLFQEFTGFGSWSKTID